MTGFFRFAVNGEPSWVTRASTITTQSGKERCHASTGAWSESSLSIMIPGFTAGLSQVRPERLIEQNEIEILERDSKQRQVDLLTKSSLRLLVDRTAVYIQ